MTVADTINYRIVPPIFLVFFTAAAQVLGHVGNPTRPFELWFLFGNQIAWKATTGIVSWALIWLWIPSKQFAGPTTSFGLTPMYQANGELYYGASLAVFAVSVMIKPTICVSIYQNMGPLLGALNILALSLCLFLLVRAKLDKDVKDPYLRTAKYPIFHEFYRGMELHPRLFGVDVKQLTNCRVGMMLWQLLILVYFVAGCQLNGYVDSGHLVNVALQTIYIFKFFHWETGYFNTLDITLDRAGYYLCWGCLVWVPSLYTFHSYYFVHHQTHCSPISAAIILVLGLISIYFNYLVDRQKQLFRSANGSQPVKIWGKKAEGVGVTYRTVRGERQMSQLMVSGFWGIGRKVNYTFELLAWLMWTIPGGLEYGIWPFIPFIFLFILLIHRVLRDEQKLRDKYGQGWTEYCKKVPYRMIPYVF